VRALVRANTIFLGDIYCESGNAYTVHIGHSTFCIGKMQHIVGAGLKNELGNHAQRPLAVWLLSSIKKLKWTRVSTVMVVYNFFRPFKNEANKYY
jgi:hypothetical protein